MGLKLDLGPWGGGAKTRSSGHREICRGEYKRSVHEERRILHPNSSDRGNGPNAVTRTEFSTVRSDIVEEFIYSMARHLVSKKGVKKNTKKEKKLKICQSVCASTAENRCALGRIFAKEAMRLVAAIGVCVTARHFEKSGGLTRSQETRIKKTWGQGMASGRQLAQVDTSVEKLFGVDKQSFSTPIRTPQFVLI